MNTVTIKRSCNAIWQPNLKELWMRTSFHTPPWERLILYILYYDCAFESPLALYIPSLCIVQPCLPSQPLMVHRRKLRWSRPAPGSLSLCTSLLLLRCRLLVIDNTVILSLYWYIYTVIVIHLRLRVLTVTKPSSRLSVLYIRHYYHCPGNAHGKAGWREAFVFSIFASETFRKYCPF